MSPRLQGFVLFVAGLAIMLYSTLGNGGSSMGAVQIGGTVVGVILIFAGRAVANRDTAAKKAAAKRQGRS